MTRRTGDIAEQEGDPPYWRILGRSSTDIIKSGGYKISALDIENTLAAHERIRNVAVLGLPDDTLGEVVAAVTECRGDPVLHPLLSLSGLNVFMIDPLHDFFPSSSSSTRGWANANTAASAVVGAVRSQKIVGWSSAGAG